MSIDDRIRALMTHPLSQQSMNRAGMGALGTLCDIDIEPGWVAIIEDLYAMLMELPEGPVAVAEDYSVAHGSPHDEDAYLLHPRDALAAFDYFKGQLCFFGHTHLPGFFELDERRGTLHWSELDSGAWVDLLPGCRYLVNPGSVGQPRDRDPRLSFMVFDPKRRRFKMLRLDYDHRGAAKAILKAGLHPHLAERLAYGM